MQYGRLTILGDVEPTLARNGSKRARVKVRCECGTVTIKYRAFVRNGGTQSCGCLQRERTKGVNTRHGHARRDQQGRKLSREYVTWQAVIYRCTNPRSKYFRHYGGRGIGVCSRWRVGENGVPGFECFLADMGPKPSSSHSIERIDNNLGYSPENCCWATRAEQARNRRNNHLVILDGQALPLVDACVITGQKYGRAVERLRFGWNESDALFLASKRD